MIRSAPMGDPFRERRYAAEDVRQIVRRAVDAAEFQKSLSQAELERAADDLGIPNDALARAIEAAPESPKTEGGGFLGGKTRILFEAEVEGEPSDRDREDLLDAIQSEIGETGAIENVGKTFGWRLGSMGGRGRDVTVRLRSRDGRTRIVVEERLARQAVGLFVGLGVGAGIGPMGAYIALIVNFGPLAALAPILWIPMTLLLARTAFGALHSRPEQALKMLFDRTVKQSATW